MQKNSNSDYDGQTIGNASLKLGKFGIDLRAGETDQASLADLSNARFVDDEVVERRTGFTGKILQDQSQFIVGNNTINDTWTYGQGGLTYLPIGGNPILLAFHYPITKQHLHTFNYDGNDVSWTGDRLLIHTNQSTKCIGNSTYWNNPIGGLSTSYRGIPCFLPSLEDKLPPIKVTGTATNSYDSSFNETTICLAYTVNGKTTAQILDRATSQLLNITTIASSTSNNANVRVISSAGLFNVFWTDLTTGNLYSASYNGAVWTSETNIVAVNAYDIDVSTGESYILVYRQGSNIKVRAYTGASLIQIPIPDSIAATAPQTPNGPVAIALKPDGNIGIVWSSSNGIFGQEYTSQLATIAGKGVITLEITALAVDTLTLVSRLTNINTINLEFVAFWGLLGGAGNTRVGCGSFSGIATNGQPRWGCTLMSRAFKVDDEVFVWLKSGNTNVNFLASGVAITRVSGYADRGEAGTPTPTGNRSLSGVNIDPLNKYKYIWARPILSTVTQTNHMRFSEINFLPQITSAQYGKTVYLSGSAVTNYDGVECSDAGFHDFPITTGGVAAASGSLSAGNYQIRAYIVRYNNKGEKFTSPALTSAIVAASASQKITWTIKTVQSCTAKDAIIEIYRTQANGTTFTLDGTVVNDQTVDTIQFVSILADTTIASNPGDVFQPQLGGLAEQLNWGPIGCTTIISHNDRLWCLGGQLTPGQVGFSKLKVTNFGAGFDAIGGFLTADSEGGKLTSIAGMNSAIIVFEKDKIFVLEDSGPDNFGRGEFPAAKFAAAKGAINHFGTKLTDVGLVYWNEGGPHLLTTQFVVKNISDQVRPIAISLIPTGVKLNPVRQEVVWYTNSGIALLWDYKSGSRWAKWSNLYINSCSDTALASNELLLKEDDTVYTDAGIHYQFSVKTNQLRAEDLLQGYTLLRRYGVVGTYVGEHQLEFRIYYNGSPLWEESEVWSPEADTYLQPASTFGSLTAAQVDALNVLDKSGNYAVHRRAQRQNCQRFQVEILDNSPSGPSLIPQTLEFELGIRPGYGRSPVTTFTDK